MPKRTSLSLMFPPDWPLPWARFTPEERRTCGAVLLGGVVDADADREDREHRRAAPSAACRRASTIFPNMNTCAAGISRIAIISRKFVIPFGFSNGTAEFEL